MIDISLQHADRIIRELNNTPKAIPGVLSRAINRTAATVKTQAGRSVREMYTVKSRDFASTISTTKASAGNLEATIKSEGSPLKLTQFAYSPGFPKQRPNIRVAVKKGAKKKIGSAFFVSAKNGLNIYTRVSKNRLPIQGSFGPSAAQMLANEDIVKTLEEKGRTELGKRAEHELKRLIGG